MCYTGQLGLFKAGLHTNPQVSAHHVHTSVVINPVASVNRYYLCNHLPAPICFPDNTYMDGENCRWCGGRVSQSGAALLTNPQVEIRGLPVNFYYPRSR